MATYFNNLTYVWKLCLNDNISYQISPGWNRNLPGSLDKKFPDLIPEHKLKGLNVRPQRKKSLFMSLRQEDQKLQDNKKEITFSDIIEEFNNIKGD